VVQHSGGWGRRIKSTRPAWVSKKPRKENVTNDWAVKPDLSFTFSIKVLKPFSLSSEEHLVKGDLMLGWPSVDATS
jgi:hypothetical protein